MIIKAAKRIFNSDKICRSYNDLNFGVTFLEHSVYTSMVSSEVVFVTGSANLLLTHFCLTQCLLFLIQKG